jgi:glutamyl-tRNA synthetase
VVKSPAAFDYEKLDWMNGVYLRAMSPQEYADALVDWIDHTGLGYDEGLVREIAPIVQEKLTRLDEFPSFAGFFFAFEAQPNPSPEVVAAAVEALEPVADWTEPGIESALRTMARELELPPGKAFQPIRIAVTGQKVSPGLFETLRVLGRETSLDRLRAV